MSTGGRDGELSKGHSGSSWEQEATHLNDYPLGSPRPFHLPSKQMDALLRGSADNMQLHLARSRVGLIVADALQGRTPAEPTQQQIFAKSLASQVPAEKLSLIPELTEIARKSAVMRRPQEQAVLSENASWFDAYNRGLEHLVTLEQHGPMLATAGKDLPMGYGKPAVVEPSASAHPTAAVPSATSAEVASSATSAIAAKSANGADPIWWTGLIKPQAVAVLHTARG